MVPSDSLILKLQAAARKRHKKSADGLLKILERVGVDFKEKPIKQKRLPLPKKKTKPKKVCYEDRKFTSSRIDHSVRSEDFQNRPPAVYDNIPSPYGIATELLWEQLKKSG